MVHLDRHPVAD